MDKGNWTYRKLGEVCDFERGLTYSKNDESPIPTENSVFRSNNVDLDTKQIVLDDIKYLVSDFCIPDSKKVRPNTILICMSNGSMQHVGKVAHIEKNYNSAFGGFMGLLIPKQECLSKYLFYFLNSSNYRHFLISIANGVNITNLKFSDLRNLNLPVPPLPIQQRIVAELDCISTILEKKRQQLKELDNLAQAIFYDMFGDPVENEKGWEVKKLGEVCLLKAGKAIKANELLLQNNNTYPCYGGNGIRGYLNRFSHTESCPIIGRQGALCGNVNYAEAPFYATEHAVVASPIIKMNSRWLYYELVAMKLNQYAHGVAQPGLAVQDIEPLLIPLPPLSLQQSFAAKIEAIEKQKERISQSIKEVQTLFDSRMEEYFG